ncbi:flagellar hook capping FlgD N-terminal domain-containing protein [Maridesulfovibrio sp.]|uniref:flagellar hook assembly protein FlgD n=1 Tax=Maridesulfovibrio sp. TaxID=2795000 RepID=UPI0029C9BA3C|nr:flagellar hook capping FlgD N-terminal domain-containing protein [Maridesulfovibrio sp.]
MTTAISSYTSSDTTTITTTTTSSDNTSLDQVDFLTLLTTQLEYQDPTNPVDNSEMINQMTNYSMLDEDVEQNENLETIINQLDSLAALSTSSYVGKEVMAEGGIITVEDGDVSDITVKVEEDASVVGLNIYDSDGNIVNTVYTTNLDAGETVISGSALSAQADLGTDGTYTVKAFAYDEDESALSVTLLSAGTVTSVEQNSGDTVLTLDDGREVSITDVSLIS